MLGETAREFYLKKCTAGLAKPSSDVEPCGEVSDTFSSQAESTSSASIPCSTRSKCPVSICHTYAVPSEQPTIRKSSSGRHLILTTGNKWRLDKQIHLRSVKLSKVTEWSDATEQILFWTRGYTMKLIKWMLFRSYANDSMTGLTLQVFGGTSSWVISPACTQNRCNSAPL